MPSLSVFPSESVFELEPTLALIAITFANRMKNDRGIPHGLAVVVLDDSAKRKVERVSAEILLVASGGTDRGEKKQAPVQKYGGTELMATLWQARGVGCKSAGIELRCCTDSWL